jgi:hypothetical protein
VVSERRTGSPTLTVTGHGRASAPADAAELSLGVELVRATAREARASAAEAMVAVIAAIRAAGVPDAGIRTSGLGLAAEMDYSDAAVPRRVGFRLTNRVTVVLEDVERVAAVVDAAIEAGATTFEGVSFRVRDAGGVRRAALLAAVADAGQSAEAIAAAAGLRLGEMTLLREGTPIGGPSPRFAMMEALASTPVLPGAVDVEASVEASWQVEPAEGGTGSATEVRFPTG